VSPAVIRAQLRALEAVVGLLRDLAEGWRAAASSGKLGINDQERLTRQLGSYCGARAYVLVLHRLGVSAVVELSLGQLAREKQFARRPRLPRVSPGPMVLERWEVISTVATTAAAQLEALTEAARAELEQLEQLERVA
jgi:hypothetical protein